MYISRKHILYLSHVTLQFELLRRMAFCIVFYVCYILSVFHLLPLLTQGLLSVLFARYSVVTPLFAPKYFLVIPFFGFFHYFIIVPISCSFPFEGFHMFYSVSSGFGFLN
jgi:hypothetical protein